MKKGALHFLGRKNQSLFDTNIRLKDMDNVELVLDSPAILESGTASVRARPTVKHHASSDNFQAFAVPTPKVPILPPVGGPKVNGSVDGDNFSNGSVISVPDDVEGEIFIPPPPSMAPPPPPPPGTFILPPPDFIGDLNSPALASLQAPTPKVSPLALSMEEVDVASLKPPPMAPPKPPSTCSTGSGSSIPITSSPPASVPAHPRFAPPQPPTEKQQKNLKTPPPKPVRLSSISNFDLPPQTPAPPPPVQTPTRSTFNPQNTAKLYNTPKISLLSRYENHDTKPKQMLLLEDSVPVIVPVDGKASNVTTPTKPVPRDTQELKENLQVTKPSPPSLPKPNKEAKTGTVSAQQVVTKPPQTPPKTPPQRSPHIQKIISPRSNSEPNKDELDEPSRQSYKFSPLLDRKLRNLKNSETTGAREAPAASPLALLMAAKEREKHRPTQSLSRENSGKRDEQPSASIYASDSSPNSFVVVPRSRSSSSASPPSQERKNLNLNSEHRQVIQTPEKSISHSLVSDHMQSTSPAHSGISAAAPVHAKNLVGRNHNTEQSLPKSAQPWDNKEEVSVPLLPPPPEFDDSDEIMDPPPSIRPPDPPVKKAPKPAASLPPPGPPPPKHKPPAAPKLPPPLVIDTKPKPQKAPTQLPTPLSPNQATLLSILQKKMLEMDHKMAPVKDTESSSDDWGSPLSDEDNKIPFVPKPSSQSRNYPVFNKTSLDMRELEGKMAKKNQGISSTKAATSNGPSKHQYGMSFTIRPGTKQPITPINKLDS
ncbi:hypothetical protein JOB18_006794 [Solea senegalensis]|uniref:Uncharacterized protein n=1 Tax=Solea senegalensis TaxID=28829 RepID=A0AAV6PKV9_SOLSE|nr:uncharacterized protein C6orf132-like [Solea senegalensis]KAG7470365.1 hypothetical protein JOB18_006794 [Solea senegalensis]KAG7470366.1 hypothetical protein JOB18_006794 [Solea senegalensis]